MSGFEAIVLSCEAVAYLVNLAMAASLMCGAGLLAARAGRHGSAPFRHGVLVWTLVLILLSPATVWLAQRSGLAMVSITASGLSDTQATANRPVSDIPDTAAAMPSADTSATETPPPFVLAGRPFSRRPLLASSSPPEPVTSEPPPATAISSGGPRPVTDGPSASLVEHRAPLSWWQVLGSLVASVWAVGAAWGLFRLGWGCVALARLCRRLGPLSDPRQKLLVHHAADALRLRKVPAAFLSRSVGVPMSIGLLRPAIILPEAMPRETDDEQLEAILLHETAHIARHDHWVGVGQRIATILFWWNPLVYRLCDEISELREEICDNHVVLIQGDGQRLARLLVDLAARVATGPLWPSTVGVLEPKMAGLTGRVSRLLNKERTMETRMNLRSRLSLLTCGAVALVGMASLGGLRVADAQPAGEIRPAVADQKSHGPADAGGETHADPFDFRGQVLDPNGKPLPGANVYFVFYTNHTHPTQPPPEVRATTGPEGNFHFTLKQSDFDTWRTNHPWGVHDDVSYRNDCRIVAQAAGYGPVWQPAFVFDQSGGLRKRMIQAYPEDAEAIRQEQDPVLRVVKDDVPLVGRIVDPKGRPVAGVQVGVRHIQPVKGEDLTGWLSAAESENADLTKLMKYGSVARVPGGGFNDGFISRETLPQIMPAATSDADGNVRLAGIGRERLVGLSIEGPGVESACLYSARTRPGATLAIPYHLPWSREKCTFYGATFEHMARPSAAIVGTVRDKDTGKRLPGVRIQAHKLADNPARSFVVAHYFHATTDADGRYRLTGMPIGKDHELLAVPPEGQPYLFSKKAVDATGGSDPVPIDFELKRGIWIRGKVTDAKTGEPVSDCIVEYYVFHDNPYFKLAPGFEGASEVVGPYQTGKDGRYAVPSLPGRGIVAVEAFGNGRTQYALRAGLEKIPELRNAGGRFDKVAPGRLYIQRKHALAEVHPAEGDESFPLDFQLDPGQTLAGTVLDPEGKPLSGAHYKGSTEEGHWSLLNSDKFSVNAYWPDQPRTLLFVHLERKLAGSLVVEGEQAGPLSVRLQPWGAVTGRVVDAAGRPMGGVEIRDDHFPTYLWVRNSHGELHHVNERYVADGDGHFRIEGLAPGFRYNPTVWDQLAGKILRMQAFEVTVQTGRTKDVGEVKIGSPVVHDSSTWQMGIKLDTPRLVPPAVQYAVLDEDPVPGFLARVKKQRAYYQERLKRYEGEPVNRQATRTAGMSVSWDQGFRDVSGADLHLLASVPSGTRSFMSNRPDGKKWVVTKTVQIEGEPTCWCVPVEVKKGETIAVTLTESNRFDLEAAFQAGMQE